MSYKTDEEITKYLSGIKNDSQEKCLKIYFGREQRAELTLDLLRKHSVTQIETYSRVEVDVMGNDEQVRSISIDFKAPNEGAILKIKYAKETLFRCKPNQPD